MVRVMYVEKRYERHEKFIDQFKERPTDTLMDEVTVYAVDHAKSITVKKGHLGILPRKYCDLPPGAVLASVGDKREWKQDQVQKFREVVMGNKFWFLVENMYFDDEEIPFITGRFYNLKELNGRPYIPLTLDELGISPSVLSPEPEPSEPVQSPMPLAHLPKKRTPYQVYVPPHSKPKSTQPPPQAAKPKASKGSKQAETPPTRKKDHSKNKYPPAQEGRRASRLDGNRFM
jgi:hypothetical protein